MAAQVVRPNIWKVAVGLAFVVVLLASLVYWAAGGGDKASQPETVAPSQPVMASPEEDPDLRALDSELDKVSADDFGEGQLADSEVGI